MIFHSFLAAELISDEPKHHAVPAAGETTSLPNNYGLYWEMVQTHEYPAVAGDWCSKSDSQSVQPNERTLVDSEPGQEPTKTSLSVNVWGQACKRLFDICVGSVLLLISLPIQLVIALLIKLDSPGPVFYHQARVGRAGVEFLYFKFRTMHPNTHMQRYGKLASRNLRHDGPLSKISNDPRVTRIGHILRRTHLDELPELFLVVLGYMSLVGPRPHLPEETDKYEDRYLELLSVIPGMTGLAQIRGGAALKFELEYIFSMDYIYNWSLWLDVKIIILTVWEVLIRLWEAVLSKKQVVC